MTVRTDPAGNLKIDKEKSTEKVDGAVALVMALDRAMKNQGSGSVYPLCANCLSKGILAPATVVDHIVPHRGDRALFWDENNWQALCKSCHDRKTGSGL